VAARGGRLGGALYLLLVAVAVVRGAAGQGAAPAAGCLGCHAGIEEMHPWFPLGCVDCHGGDASGTTLESAHVTARVGFPPDERVLHAAYELPALRFRNPSDLRVVQQTCGECHADIVADLPLSLHGTTAGHLNDGLYENGLNPTRQARFGIFAVQDGAATRPADALAALRPIAHLAPSGAGGLADHFADLPRKACMQCHLWSNGIGMEGRLGQDGSYRGAGCAACHVTYAEDGRSGSADATADHFEPGHPQLHRMTAAPPTSSCTSCHVGDASIGNGFRGLAQLYPQMPAGPAIPGTTDRLLAGQFFQADELLLPPDLHHAAGMHCIDCHTARDVMGDGRIWGAMEHAVEIECTSCHGTAEAYADGLTSQGRPVTNLQRSGDLFVLRSKVTDRRYRVKQVKDVVDPTHPDYDPRAVPAMDSDHARLECYACHSGWNTNFFGFHFDRNEQFRQLDLITGDVTPGVVTTQERVFATLRQYLLGINPEGRIAPYMVGFSSMGTVHAADGSLLLDQELPRTAEGLSGMTLVHHQTHTTQRAARSCVECHRSPATWGLGSGGDTGGSFALARGLLVTAGERGVETLLLDRENPDQSVYLARLPLGGARRLALDSHPVTGHAETAFVAIEHAGVALVDVRNPAFPAVRSFVAAGDARDVALDGDLLLVANGVGGLRVVDVADRDRPRLLADLVTREARGLCVRWPWVYVADGPGGLVIADLSVPSQPAIVGQVSLGKRADQPDDAEAVDVLFQYGRPQGGDARSPARTLAAVANGGAGLTLLDVTEPSAVRSLSIFGDDYSAERRVLDVALLGRFELGDTTGLTPTRERDLLHVLNGRGAAPAELMVLDLTDASTPQLVVRRRVQAADDPSTLALARSFNPPALQTRLLVAAASGLALVDVTDSDEPLPLASFPMLGPLADVAVEAFAFDRLQTASGRPLKDVSHPGAAFLPVSDVHRVLSVPGQLLGTLDDGGASRAELRTAFADRALPGGTLARSLPLDALETQARDERLDRLRRGFRIGPSEPLARMVRGMELPAFDGNGDGALSRGELERLFFALLDADADGVLGPLEWPRHPAADPPQLDRDGDGRVARSEMQLDDEVLAAFDVDGDGRVQRDEWPWEVVDDPLPSLAYCPPDGLRALIGRMGFERARPLLYRVIAGSTEEQRITPRDIPDERLEQFLVRARNRPLDDVLGERVLGGFLRRWDLDGDGAVRPDEHLAWERVARRCDRDGNGRIDAADAPTTR